MRDSRKKLTRDSDLYQGTIRTKTINNMGNNSRILEILDARHTYTYNCKIKHPVWNSINKSRDNIDRSQLKNIRDMNPVSRAKDFGKEDNCPDDDEWRAFGEYSIRMEIKLYVELPDGDKIELLLSEDFEEFNDIERIGCIYDLVESDTNINVTLEEDKYHLESEKYSYYAYETLESSNSDGFNIRKQNYENTEKLLIFFSNKHNWVEATIDDLLIENEDIVLPIRYASNTNDNARILFNFSDPETNKELWDLVEKLGVGDPMMMSGENVYLTHTIVTNQSLIDNGVWSLSIEKPEIEQRRGILDYSIVEGFKKLFSN